MSPKKNNPKPIPDHRTTARLGKVETPQQASKRYDVIQKQLRDDFYRRNPGLGYKRVAVK